MDSVTIGDYVQRPPSRRGRRVAAAITLIILLLLTLIYVGARGDRCGRHASSRAAEKGSNNVTFSVQYSGLAIDCTYTIDGTTTTDRLWF